MTKSKHYEIIYDYLDDKDQILRVTQLPAARRLVKAMKAEKNYFNIRLTKVIITTEVMEVK